MANRSARTAASFSSGVRVMIAASLRMSDRCCSSSSLVPHSICLSHRSTYNFTRPDSLLRNLLYAQNPTLPLKACNGLIKAIVGKHDGMRPISRYMWPRREFRLFIGRTLAH
jgi:hypothetical protein